jgi:hypothetical protein
LAHVVGATAYIALKVGAQLDKAEVFRWLLPEELSLRKFLVEQIKSLQMVVEAQDVASSSAQAPMSPAQASVALTLVQSEVEDECLKAEVLLHIAFEVISQLDKVTEFRWLSSRRFPSVIFLLSNLGLCRCLSKCKIPSPWLKPPWLRLGTFCLYSLLMLQPIDAQVSWPQSCLLCEIADMWST